MPNNTQTDVDAIIAAHMAANPDSIMVTSGSGGSGEALPAGMVSGMSITQLAAMRGTFTEKDALTLHLRRADGGQRQTSVAGQSAWDVVDFIDRATGKLYRFGANGQVPEHLGLTIKVPKYRGPAGTPSGAIRK